jgi:ABC-2 type transport system permease protein
LAVVFTTAFAGNIYGFDGSSLWLTLTTPEAERADVRGRQLAWLLIVAPVASTLTIIFTMISGQSWGWPLAAASIPALLGSGAGVLVLLSVRMLVPATDPHRRGRSIVLAGDDMEVGQLQVQGFLSLAIMAALLAPAAAVTLLGIAMQCSDLQWAGIALGPITGLTVYWWFGRLAYQGLATRGPTLLTLMTKGRSSRQSRL